MEKLQLKTKDLTAGNIAKLSVLFPSLITEVEKDGKIVKTINASKLKEIVGDYATNDSEVYELTWVGKQESKQKIVAPITKTLRPVVKDSVDFENTENLYIEGDNFEVLKVLQESYLNNIKMIYIDPPYNTGNDFVYKDNFSMSRKEYDDETGAIDEEGNKLFKNTTTNGRFHSDWLSMMYERLVVARDLLRDDGVIFISIDDNEVHNLRKICDEIFGEENFVNCIAIKMAESTGVKMAHVEKRLPKLKEYLMLYKKSEIKITPTLVPKDKWDSEYKHLVCGVEKEELSTLKEIMTADGIDSKDISVADDICMKMSLTSIDLLYQENDAKTDEKKMKVLYENAWRIVRDVATTGGAKKIADEKKKNTKSPYFVIQTPKEKVYLIKRDYSDIASQPRIKLLFADTYLASNPGDFWQDIKTTGLDNEGDVDFKNGKKPLKMIDRMLKTISHRDDIILDFFSGSATTAHAVMQQNAEDGGNRKFIMVQLPEPTAEDSEAFKAGYKNICEIGKERIRRAAKKIKEDNKGKDLSKIDFGFRVFRLDSSNMKDVYYNPEELNQTTLTNFKDNIKEDRTDKDLLYQVLLDLAVPISAKVEEQQIMKKRVYRVNDNFLIACFDEKIDLETVKEIAKLNPLRLVFKDSSFKDDSAKVNADEYMKHKLPGCIVRVI